MLNVTYPQNQDVSALVRPMLLSGRDSLTHCYWCPFSLTSESFLHHLFSIPHLRWTFGSVFTLETAQYFSNCFSGVSLGAQNLFDSLNNPRLCLAWAHGFIVTV